MGLFLLTWSCHLAFPFFLTLAVLKCVWKILVIACAAGTVIDGSPLRSRLKFLLHLLQTLHSSTDLCHNGHNFSWLHATYFSVKLKASTERMYLSFVSHQLWNSMDDTGWHDKLSKAISWGECINVKVCYCVSLSLLWFNVFGVKSLLMVTVYS